MLLHVFMCMVLLGAAAAETVRLSVVFSDDGGLSIVRKTSFGAFEDNEAVQLSYNRTYAATGWYDGKADGGR